MSKQNKIYLGDSVYVQDDPHITGSFVLTTENGYSDDPRNEIYIDYGMILDLLQWAQHEPERRTS